MLLSYIVTCNTTIIQTRGLIQSEARYKCKGNVRGDCIHDKCCMSAQLEITLNEITLQRSSSVLRIESRLYCPLIHSRVIKIGLKNIFQSRCMYSPEYTFLFYNTNQMCAFQQSGDVRSMLMLRDCKKI